MRDASDWFGRHMERCLDQRPHVTPALVPSIRPQPAPPTSVLNPHCQRAATPPNAEAQRPTPIRWRATRWEWSCTRVLPKAQAAWSRHARLRRAIDRSRPSRAAALPSAQNRQHTDGGREFSKSEFGKLGLDQLNGRGAAAFRSGARGAEGGEGFGRWVLLEKDLSSRSNNILAF